MTDSAQRKEVDAFLGFFSAFELSQPVVTISDLSDGAVLFQVLSLVYVFPLISHPPGIHGSYQRCRILSTNKWPAIRQLGLSI